MSMGFCEGVMMDKGQNSDMWSGRSGTEQGPVGSIPTILMVREAVLRERFNSSLVPLSKED